MADLSKIKLNGTVYNFKDAEARNLIENLNSFEIAMVSSLPTSDINDHTIYFVPQAVNSSTHDEYMYINNNWELIGNTSVDLSGYLQKTEIAAWAKAASKPTYTASEVGALPDTTVIPAATTVTNTLASGTLIATINGTNIYAPTYTNGDNLAYGG